jgi:hypothetical protein
MKHPNSKNKQNQANSERGFVLATAVVHLNLNLPNSKKTQKSSKIKPTPNEVLSSPRPSTITKKHKNQAKSSQVRTRFCLRHACHPRHPNSKKCEKSSKVWTRFSPFAIHEIKQYHSKKSKKSSKVKPSPNEVFALRHARVTRAIQ